MKVKFEFDTRKKNFVPCELEQVKHAADMACALYQLEKQFREWYNYPDDTVPLTADSLLETFHDIMYDNNLIIDKLWN